MLAEDVALETEKRTLAQVARRNAEQLLWQVNNLLDQARIAAGQMLIDPCPTSIADIMDHVMATLAGVPRRPGVELRCSGQTRVPPRLMIDGQRFQQILINLGANALKFTDHGAVQIATSWDAGWLTVSIEDTGQGIPTDALERIFEPFEQSALNARRNGTGLGLTISRNLARLMGGDLTVTSAVGVGSTFRLRVPAAAAPVTAPMATPVERLVPQVVSGRGAAARVEAQAAPAVVMATTAAAPAAPVVAAPVAASVAPRAVIADDSEDIRIFLSVSLRRMGLDVSLAENGDLAVKMALAEQPDVVLLDVQMPVMGGPEAAQALRRAGFTRLLIALTAGSGDALESDLLAAGFDAVMFKPVSGLQLSNVITGLLTGQRDTRPAASATAKAALRG
jgi:CheY-like chemotaxis protein